MSSEVDSRALAGSPSLAKQFLAQHHNGHSRTSSEVELVQVSPSSTITFEWSPGTELHSQFAIRNMSNKRQVAFKIKTTAPDVYRVRPATSIMDPGTTIFVKVVRSPTKTIKEAETEGHRFVIVCVPVKFGEDGKKHAESELEEQDAPVTTRLKVKVVPRNTSWPANNEDLTRLALQVERRLREAVVVDGPERQSELMMQFTVLLLTRGMLHMNQLKDIKELINHLCDAKKLEEEYWRARSAAASRSGSRQHSRSGSLAQEAGSPKAPKNKSRSLSVSTDPAPAQQEPASATMAKSDGKASLIEQFLCNNPMFEPSAAEKPPASPAHRRRGSGVSETWEKPSSGQGSPSGGVRDSKAPQPSRLSQPGPAKPAKAKRLGGRKGDFADDLSDLSLGSDDEYGDHDWSSDDGALRSDLEEMLAQPGNGVKAAEVPADALEDHKLGKHVRNSSSSSSFSTSSYGATPMQMRVKEDNKEDKGKSWMKMLGGK